MQSKEISKTIIMAYAMIVESRGLIGMINNHANVA